MIPREYPTIPSANEAEVTLIGAGSYGESLVCHLGNNDWVIIDSCIDPNDKAHPLPLEYLHSIGVSSKNIKLIICTHWHDDHIKGISKILESAINAEFCISRAHDLKKFLAFVGMDSMKGSNNSTKEFTNCLQILIQRNKQYVEAMENRPIFKTDICSLICLSPSDFTTQQFDKEIVTLIQEYSAINKRIPYSSPNLKSIVLFAKMNAHRAIFGADLETTNNEREGWDRVVENKISIDKKSSLFKVSHHGSENGYNENIWKNLLIEKPVAKLTPWKRGGNSIPNDEMITKYLTHTDRLYMTELVISNKQKKRDSQIEKLIKELKPELQEIKYKLGIIRSRINLDDENSNWKVENLVGAKKIS